MSRKSLPQSKGKSIRQYCTESSRENNYASLSFYLFTRGGRVRAFLSHGRKILPSVPSNPHGARFHGIFIESTRDWCCVDWFVRVTGALEEESVVETWRPQDNTHIRYRRSTVVAHTHRSSTHVPTANVQTFSLAPAAKTSQLLVETITIIPAFRRLQNRVPKQSFRTAKRTHGALALLMTHLSYSSVTLADLKLLITSESTMTLDVYADVHTLYITTRHCAHTNLTDTSCTHHTHTRTRSFTIVYTSGGIYL